MSRLALRRRTTAPLGMPPQPLPGMPQTFEDPRGPGPHATLPYRQATELLRCIDIMGPKSDAWCRHAVLGDPLPTPEFRHETGITSPVPFAATTAPDGSVNASIGDIEVRILPDARTADPKMTNRAETKFTPAPGRLSWVEAGGRVRNVRIAKPVMRITIVTTYGPGATPGGRSAYGRGTTAADIAAGDISLGFHEGRHGVDFLHFMAGTPHPVFAGSDGMTLAEIRKAWAAYQAAWQQFLNDMGHGSVHGTDCVGSTAAASDAVKIICTDRHAAAGAGAGTGGGP